MLVRILRDYHAALQEISAFEFKSYKIFGENLTAFILNPTKVYWDVPTIVRASVLELAKFHMYKFHYDIMKPNFECQLLYSDTDSLLYQVKSEDLYREFSKKGTFWMNLTCRITRWTALSTTRKTKMSCFKIQGWVSRRPYNRVNIPQTQALFHFVLYSIFFVRKNFRAKKCFFFVLKKKCGSNFKKKIIIKKNGRRKFFWKKIFCQQNFLFKFFCRGIFFWVDRLLILFNDDKFLRSHLAFLSFFCCTWPSR